MGVLFHPKPKTQLIKIMERQEEIKQLLRHLLGKVDESIDSNQYSDDLDSIIESCKGVLENAELIKKYIKELKQ
jgi:hypothetical protein